MIQTAIDSLQESPYMPTKKCPYCAEEIQEEALKCKHCGTWLSSPSSNPSGGLAGSKKMARSSTDKMIAGVCGGLADYLGIDATIVRILFVVLSLGLVFTPVLLYIAMIFVMPLDTEV